MLQHRLLVRQVRKHLGPTAELGPEWKSLLAAVEEAYTQFDGDRQLFDRAMGLSSAELMEANQRLTEQNAHAVAVLEKLRASVRALRTHDGTDAPTADDIFALTDVLDELIRQRNAAEAGMRTSLKNTSLKPDWPFACLIGRTSTPGESIRRKNIVSPLCLGTTGSVRVIRRPHCEC